MKDMSHLPWIDIKDEEAIILACKYLTDEPVIVEAGACDGEDTVRFAKMWPGAKIYTFEPVPDLYEIAVRNTAAFGNIKVEPYALYSKSGYLEFNLSTTHRQASSFLEDNLKNITAPETVREEFEDSARSYKDEKITVSTMTLDTWCDIERVERIDYLWLDTEGTELDVLHGAKRILDTVEVISIELNFQEFRKGMSMFDDVYWTLDKAGFELMHIWQGHANWQGNGIFVRRENPNE